MKTKEHQSHIENRISHAACSECRADSERRWVDGRKWKYEYIHEYLEYIRPRLTAALVVNTPEAKLWLEKFRKALDRRISLKLPMPQGRKYNDAFLERLKGLKSVGMSRREIFRKASCLDYY